MLEGRRYPKATADNTTDTKRINLEENRNKLSGAFYYGYQNKIGINS